MSLEMDNLVTEVTANITLDQSIIRPSQRHLRADRGCCRRQGEGDCAGGRSEGEVRSPGRGGRGEHASGAGVSWVRIGTASIPGFRSPSPGCVALMRTPSFHA